MRTDKKEIRENPSNQCHMCSIYINCKTTKRHTFLENDAHLAN